MDATANALAAIYAERARRHPEDPYAWHMAHRSIGGQPLWHMDAIAQILLDDHPFVVIQKSAQVGVTEALVSLAMWAADTRYAGRGNALYLMPTASQMSDFAQGRFDRAIQDSTYLRSRLQPEPPRRKGVDSTRLKRIGDGYVYLRGSESARQVASVDADVVILDEYDQMADGILDLAHRRVASSRRGLVRVASTPRYPETGINGLYLQSDQHEYWIPCGHCGMEQRLVFPDNIDEERMLVVCWKCWEPLDVLIPGRWIAGAPTNRIRGYLMPRLLSPWLNVRDLVTASQDTTLAGTEQFQNSDLGEVFSPPGSSVSLADLDGARRDYTLADYAGQPTTMGVDVGSRLHVVIREWPSNEARRARIAKGTLAPRRLWYAAEVSTFHELDGLVDRFNVGQVVVDAQPESHAAAEFAQRHSRIAWVAQYRSTPGHERDYSARPRRYHISRTQALERVFDAYRTGEALLPANARELGGRLQQGMGEYYREVMAQQRTLEQDANGNWQSRFIDRGRADHYAHAEVYCAMAGDIPPPAQVSVASR